MEILTVGQLTASIKQKLESSFGLVAVRGEVGNLTRQASGHIYFTLKDKDAQISSVLFRGNAANLTRIPKEGDQIVAKGELSVYAPRGAYQLIVREVEFSGTGELLKKLHELKLKLEKMGWFDPALKKKIPSLPKTIGIVTSPTGAVIQDVLNVLSRRFPGFHLILNPVKVQGAGAAEEIAQAIEDFNRYALADVLIVGRGGGSLEDLWCFNEEIVATAIRNSTIPVISAVGHETDFTIADFVADLRAPTPSAAAEMVIVEKSQLLTHLAKTGTRLVHTLRSQMRSHQKILNSLAKQPPLGSPLLLLSNYFQKVDQMREELTDAVFELIKKRRFILTTIAKQKETLKPSQQIAHLRQNFSKIERSIHWATEKRLQSYKGRLDQLVKLLFALDPRNVLKKGYSILFHEKNDSVILSSTDVQVDETIRVHLSDGKLLVTVKERA